MKKPASTLSLSTAGVPNLTNAATAAYYRSFQHAGSERS
jgi:hypothetical protein